MYNFKNDYNRACHPLILENLMIQNNNQYDGYSEDTLSEETRGKIREALNYEACDIHFMPGGTHTNMTFIASVLRPHQGVIASTEGHIFVHETGAIEATGHKIITIDTDDGKINAEEIKAVIDGHYDDETREHVVQPGMVYISNPTELGTIYSRAELKEIHDLCQSYDIPLYIDGARLAMALTAKSNDLEMTDLCHVCDAFYIGGAKCGAMFGECLVIANDRYKKDFRYILKQRGGMVSKGFVVASQFNTLFTDNLYLELGQYTNELAQRIGDQVNGKVTMYQEQITNQVFLILPNEKIDSLSEKFDFYRWVAIDESTSAIRVCVSWGTDSEKVDELIEAILA